MDDLAAFRARHFAAHGAADDERVAAAVVQAPAHVGKERLVVQSEGVQPVELPDSGRLHAGCPLLCDCRCHVGGR
jgi:hypothetical protein